MFTASINIKDLSKGNIWGLSKNFPVLQTPCLQYESDPFSVLNSWLTGFPWNKVNHILCCWQKRCGQTTPQPPGWRVLHSQSRASLTAPSSFCYNPSSVREALSVKCLIPCKDQNFCLVVVCLLHSPQLQSFHLCHHNKAALAFVSPCTRTGAFSRLQNQVSAKCFTAVW